MSVLTQDEIRRLLEEGLAESARTEEAIHKAVVELEEIRVSHVLWQLWQQGRVQVRINDDGTLSWRGVREDAKP
jgi:hypothetical protein